MSKPSTRCDQRKAPPTESVGTNDPYSDPYTPAGLAYRCGSLTVALELVLQVLDDDMVTLSLVSEGKVATARKLLAEHGARTAVTG